MEGTVFGFERTLQRMAIGVLYLTNEEMPLVIERRSVH